MNVAIVLIILALLLGGVGLFIEALRWVLIIALVLLVWGAVTGQKARVGLDAFGVWNPLEAHTPLVPRPVRP